MSKVLQEKGSGNLPCSTKTNPRDHVKSISTTVDADTALIRRIGPGRYAVSGPQNSKLFFMPRQATVPFPSRLYDDCYDEDKGSCRLKNFYAYSIGTTPLNDALPPKEKDPRRLGKLASTKLIFELADRIVKHPKDPLYGDYIKLNGLNEPLELRRNRVDDLEPTIEEGEDKIGCKGKNVVGDFINIPIFVGNFSVETDFAIVENMDAYRDDGMGDVIV
ncbi:hypothetical protein Tco_0596083 [Tanacetum coccineum]